jgi:hypothetical protein
MFSALTIISAFASDSLELQQVEEVNPQTLHGPHGLLQPFEKIFTTHEKTKILTKIKLRILQISNKFSHYIFILNQTPEPFLETTRTGIFTYQERFRFHFRFSLLENNGSGSGTGSGKLRVLSGSGSGSDSGSGPCFKP